MRKQKRGPLQRLFANQPILNDPVCYYTCKVPQRQANKTRTPANLLLKSVKSQHVRKCCEAPAQSPFGIQIAFAHEMHENATVWSLQFVFFSIQEPKLFQGVGETYWFAKQNPISNHEHDCRTTLGRPSRKRTKRPCEGMIRGSNPLPKTTQRGGTGFRTDTFSEGSCLPSFASPGARG